MTLLGSPKIWTTALRYEELPRDNYHCIVCIKIQALIPCPYGTLLPARAIQPLTGWLIFFSFFMAQMDRPARICRGAIQSFGF